MIKVSEVTPLWKSLYTPEIKGFELVGILERDSINEGFLLQNQKTGIYCSYLGGALRSLPQREIKEALINAQ